MRPAHVPAAISCILAAGCVPFLWGPPGIGKSDLVRMFCADNQLIFDDQRLSQMDSVDLRGCPWIDKDAGLTRWSPPEILPITGRGMLFLDEMLSANQSVQAASYQLILDRRIGKYALPNGWNVIAASNRAGDRALVNQMSTALKNRFIHIEVETNVHDWCIWAMRNGIDDDVISFIRFRPSYLNEFDPRNDSQEEHDRVRKVRNSRAFSTQRSVASLSRLKQQAPKPEIELEIFSGAVGESCASEFLGFIKIIRDCPNLDTLLLQPLNARVPTEPAILYAVATGLASRAKVDNFDRVVQYTRRMPKEFQSLVIKDAILRTQGTGGKDSPLETTPAFRVWCMENADYML